MVELTSIDHENSGMRDRRMPAGRSAMTVVATHTDPRPRATIIAPSDTLPSRAAARSAPSTPPSTQTLAMNTPPDNSQVHRASEAARGKAMAGEASCRGTMQIARPRSSGTTPIKTTATRDEAASMAVRPPRNPLFDATSMLTSARTTAAAARKKREKPMNNRPIDVWSPVPTIRSRAVGVGRSDGTVCSISVSGLVSVSAIRCPRVRRFGADCGGRCWAGWMCRSTCHGRTGRTLPRRLGNLEKRQVTIRCG